MTTNKNTEKDANTPKEIAHEALIKGLIDLFLDGFITGFTMCFLINESHVKKPTDFDTIVSYANKESKTLKLRDILNIEVLISNISKSIEEFSISYQILIREMVVLESYNFDNLNVSDDDEQLDDDEFDTLNLEKQIDVKNKKINDLSTKFRNDCFNFNFSGFDTGYEYATIHYIDNDIVKSKIKSEYDTNREKLLNQLISDKLIDLSNIQNQVLPRLTTYCETFSD